MSKENYKYVLYSSGPNYGSRPRFIDINDAPDSGGFCSLYQVDKATAEAIEQAGTAKNFKGVVRSERLWIDVDSYQGADTTESKLKEMGYDYTAYDTGGRGAHFGILRDTVASHLLPYQDKGWVEQHFPEADSSIYTHLHPFRLPGTPHQRTGKRKLSVSRRVGSSLRLPQYTDIRPNKVHEGLVPNAKAKSIFDIHFIQRNSEKAQVGDRHAQLVRLVYALKENGYSLEVARWWVSEVNKRFNLPKDESELEKLIRSIYV